MMPGSHGAILVVDDEETTRNTLADILELEGYTVHSVASGEKALSFLEEEKVDLIILDLKMPGMDGLDVLRIVYGQGTEIMVILLTAYGSLESAVEALRQHACDYLVKPVSPQQLLESTQRALESRAELLRKQALLEEMEASLRQLLEPGYGSSSLEHARPADDKVVYLGNGVRVDFNRRELWRGAGAGQVQRIHLTPTEGKLLKVLLERVGEVLTHKELVLTVQGYEVTDREAPDILRPLVSRLRQKLAYFPGGEQWIWNVRGKGYLFERRGTKGISS